MTIVTPQIVPLIFVASGVLGVVTALAGLLLIQAIVIAFFGVETSQCSLEALHPERVSTSEGRNERLGRHAEQSIGVDSVADADF
jgi:MFS transporter, putative metabolite:H+ symporter